MIQTVGTDVVVLTVAAAQALKAGDGLWLAFGTRKSLPYLAAHEISAALGPEKARALLVFYALTGCDTVSSLAGQGKKTLAFNTIVPVDSHFLKWGLNMDPLLFQCFLDAQICFALLDNFCGIVVV